MECEEARPLIDASLDGQLDLRHGLAVEEHLGRCAGCAAVYRQRCALIALVRSNAEHYTAPEGLRAPACRPAGARAGCTTAGAPDGGKAVTATAAKARPISAALVRVNAQRVGRPRAAWKSCDEHIVVSKLLLNATNPVSVP